MEEKICKRCQRPVIKYNEKYEIFEGMHWLCFHLEFEHDCEPDEPCGDPSCPWLHIQIFENKLKSLNQDPEEILNEAFKKLYPSKIKPLDDL
jgi:hypothetical protein